MLRSTCHPRTLLLVLLLASAPTANAQFAEAVPGARVRIEAPGIVAGKYEGTVLARETGVVRVAAPNSSPIDVPIDRITSFEISRGKSRSAGAGRGVAIGVPTGLVLGLLGALSSAESRAYWSDGRRDTLSRGEVVLYSTVAGAFWGAVIGALVPKERWERFQVAPRSGFDTRRRRTELGLSLAY